MMRSDAFKAKMRERNERAKANRRAVAIDNGDRLYDARTEFTIARDAVVQVMERLERDLSELERVRLKIDEWIAEEKADAAPRDVEGE